METKDFVRMLKNKNNLDGKLKVMNQECKKSKIYKQALDKIEKCIKEYVCDEECGFNWDKPCPDCDCRYNDIIDIISKAKDRKNA